MKSIIFMKNLVLILFFIGTANFTNAQSVDWTWYDGTGCVDSIKVKDALNNVLGMSTSCCGSAVCLTGTPASFEIFEGASSYLVYMNVGPSVNCNSPNGTCSNTFCGFGKYWTTTYVGGGTICSPSSRILTLSISLTP